MISVIVPFYNGNKYINKLINSINKNAVNLHLKYPNINVEMIIVNDSVGTEVEIFKETSQSDISIMIINNDRNRGIHYSRVNGLKHARGEFVVFLDQDDEVEENLLLLQKEQIKENDVIVCSGVFKYSDKEKIIYKDKLQHNCVKDINKYITVSNQIISPGQCLIKKSSIPKQWNKMIMKYNGADDYFLWILMLAQKKSFIINEQRLFFHIINGENKSLDVRNMEKSVDEMVIYLKRANCLKKKQISTLERCNRYRQGFRHSGLFMKIIYSLKYFDLAIINLHYFFVYDKKQR